MIVRYTHRSRKLSHKTAFGAAIAGNSSGTKALGGFSGNSPFLSEPLQLRNITARVIERDVNGDPLLLRRIQRVPNLPTWSPMTPYWAPKSPNWTPT
ncbi:hypothetical protein TNCV_4159481 [Trichonephila clavipes]|nr:hypothetical protein TNCV_4159481 [Trichonephila clavipes]